MKARFSLIISFGKYGGFYLKKGYCIRLCLGWVALTYLPQDIDNFFDKILNQPHDQPKD